MKQAIGRFFWISVVWIGLLGGGCSMNGQASHLAAYPQQVQFGAAASQRVYVQKTGYYAVHYARPEEMLEPQATSEAIGVMEAEAIAIFAGAPSDRDIPTSARLSPVYAGQPNGPMAVPTGKVFVRFAANVPAESHQDAIQAAGYQVVEQPPYSPQAAWVQARSGNIADALSHLDRLTAIPDLENVEPQMLMQRSLRN